MSIPALQNFFKLRYGAGGIGVKYVMGHSILKAEMEKGTLKYDFEKNGNDITNQLDVDGRLKIQTAGGGFSGNWDSENPFSHGLPVSGHGIGIDLGGILYDNHGTMVINIQNLGVLFWMKNVQEVTYPIKKSDLDFYDIIDGIDKENIRDPKLSIFNRDAGEYFPTEKDSLEDGNGFVTFLPLSLNFGYSYSWDFSKIQKKGLRFLSEYANASANYEQQLSVGPGRRFIPRLSIGGESGTLHGYVPVRLGLVFGGPELLASAVGLGFNVKYFSINVSYKAIGSPVFIPRRGMVVATGLNFSWGMSIDTDKDGIPDKDDKCPTNPEDPDGFEDNDGCPDYDNDQDGILDGVDNCINIPEDKDGFEDADGCPDYDNDKDGIPDSLDKCINEPEDRDNFQDDDGCPDFDNDGDGVADSVDKCPNLPEDIDLFEDTDGCPDYDNDKDGVPDTTDQCISDPETYQWL